MYFITRRSLKLFVVLLISEIFLYGTALSIVYHRHIFNLFTHQSNILCFTYFLTKAYYYFFVIENVYRSIILETSTDKKSSIIRTDAKLMELYSNNMFSRSISGLLVINKRGTISSQK